eukprot:m.15633 g.15633  ORF g.15633 m.15633 type:complete len:91 (-) comp5458_c0_seq2:100-372(-)
MGSEEQVAVEILLFGAVREHFGEKNKFITLPFKKTTGKDLLAFLCTPLKGLENYMEQLMLAINEEYVDLDSTISISVNDEIAIIPPLSGG